MVDEDGDMILDIWSLILRIPGFLISMIFFDVSIWILSYDNGSIGLLSIYFINASLCLNEYANISRSLISSSSYSIVIGFSFISTFVKD